MSRKRSSSKPTLSPEVTHRRTFSRSRHVGKVTDLKSSRDLIKGRLSYPNVLTKSSSTKAFTMKEVGMPLKLGRSSKFNSTSLPKLEAHPAFGGPKNTDRKVERPLLNTRSNTLTLRTQLMSRPRPRSLTNSTRNMPSASHMRTMSDVPFTETLNVVSKCGFKTRTGSIMSQPKKNNQDAYIIVPNVGDVRGKYIFGVCDGHGTHGHDVSAYVKQKLPQYIAELLVGGEDTATANYVLTECFMQVDRELRAGSIDVTLSGTTCCVTYIKGKELICANSGDSRAVLARHDGTQWKSIDLSVDHKADLPGEHKRIIEAGGRVEPYYDAVGAPLGPYRVWLASDDLPGLAMSRSIGDTVAASVGVTCEPEMIHIVLEPQDKFIILASDGVWEFISSMEAIDIVAAEWERGNAEGCCDRLVKESLRRWRREEEVVDDITAVVIFLNVPE